MINPTLYPFFSVLQASSVIKTVSAEKKLISWLSELQKPSDDYILDSLRLHRAASSAKIQKREKIAHVYAGILARHFPQDNGEVHKEFDYQELVYVVGKVFKKHIRKDEDLFLSGILVKQFAAKVEKDQVYLFVRSGKALGEGGYGKVQEIYEIVSQQNLALKQSFMTAKSLNILAREITRLNRVHRDAGILSTEGLQDPPLAVFNIHKGDKFFGFIGKKYEICLRRWADGQHESRARLALCKSMMHAFKNKTELNLWHGDLKVHNIMVQNGKAVIIDLAGSITLQEAAEKLIIPPIMSDCYILDRDFTRLKLTMRALSLVNKLDIKEERIRVCQEFFVLAHAMELFAMAIVMYATLNGEDPFAIYSRNGRLYFAFEDGLKKTGLQKLIDTYGIKVAEPLSRMLSYRFEDRYSVQEAIDIWEKL